MDRRTRTLNVLVSTFFFTAVVALYRLIRWKLDGGLTPVSSWYGSSLYPLGLSFSPLWDIPVAALVSALAVGVICNPRTWSFDDEPPIKHWLFTFYVTWVMYGAMFGIGCSIQNGLTLGMAMGFAGALVLIVGFTLAIRIFRLVEWLYRSSSERKA